jgi:CDP-diglyceride synthetase
MKIAIRIIYALLGVISLLAILLIGAALISNDFSEQEDKYVSIFWGFISLILFSYLFCTGRYLFRKNRPRITTWGYCSSFFICLMGTLILFLNYYDTVSTDALYFIGAFITFIALFYIWSGIKINKSLNKSLKHDAQKRAS